MPRRALGVLVPVLVAANIWIYAAIASPGRLGVETLLVEQRSVGLVRLPRGHAVLVGAGPDASIVRTLGEALPPWQRSLDAVVLLGVSADEVGGAPFVLEHYQVGRLIRPEIRGAAGREAVLAVAIAAAGIPTTNIPPHGRVFLRYGSESLELSVSGGLR